MGSPDLSGLPGGQIITLLQSTPVSTGDVGTDAINGVNLGAAILNTLTDAVSAVLDPVGYLIGLGLGYAVEYAYPLNQVLDALIGDPDKVTAFSGTWTGISNQLANIGNDFSASINGLDGMTGAMVNAYTTYHNELTKQIFAAVNWAWSAADALSRMSDLVSQVRDFVTGLLTAVVSAIISAILEILLTLGFGTPFILVKLFVTITPKITKGIETTMKVVDAAQLLVGLLQTLMSFVQQIVNTVQQVSSLRQQAAVTK